MNATLKEALTRIKARIEPTAENQRASRIAAHLAKVEQRLRKPAASRPRASGPTQRHPHTNPPQIGPSMLAALSGRMVCHALFAKHFGKGGVR